MPEGNAAVQRMFSGIASRYDFANRVLSLGLCVGWREPARQAAASRPPSPRPWRTSPPAAATSPSPCAATCPQDCAVVGYDFCEPMLEIGRAARESRQPSPWNSRPATA